MTETPDLTYLDDDVIDINKLRLRTEAFPPEVRTILEEPIVPQQISVKQDGKIYMTHVWYREKFNKAFGYGAWAVRPLCEWIVDEKSKKITRDYGLFVGGKFITEASSSHPYAIGDDLGDARESVRSGSYVRLGKDLGIGKTLWDRAWVAQFLRTNVICVGFWTRKKSKEGDWGNVIAKGFRLITDIPLEGEVGPWIQNANGFYDDRRANTTPVTGDRFAPYALPEGFSLPGGKSPSQPAHGATANPPTQHTPAPASAPTAAPTATPGMNPAPISHHPTGGAAAAEDTAAATKANRRFIYDAMAKVHGSDPANLGDCLAAMTKLVLGITIRSYQQLNFEQSKKLRDSIEQKRFDVPSMSLSESRLFS